MDKTYQRLLEIKKRALAPYSQYSVGAIAHTDKGDFEGFNIECSVFPLSLCAERVALFSALAQGAKKITALSLITDSVSQNGTPCGSCRQVLVEYMDKDAMVSVYSAKGSLRQYSVGELLPFAFVAKQREGLVE